MNNTLTMDSVREASLDRAKLQSATIDFLRFPMAVAVVMIHVNPQVMPLNEADFPLFSADGLFNVVAIGLSHVLARIAVPVFFLLSGMLFFLNMRQLSWGGYRAKLKSRVHTLIIPYLLWNLVPFIAGVMLDVAVGIKHGHGLANLWGYLSVDSLSVLWSHGTWNADNVNILGFRFVPSGPYDFPLWFLRDLIVVVVLSPVIYWFIRKTRVFGLGILFAAYFTEIWIPWPGFSPIAFLFFSIGAYFSIEGKDIIGFVRANKYVISAGALLFFVPATYYDGYFTPEGKWLVNVFRVFGVFAAFLVASALVEYRGWRANRFLVSACFFIYALHAVPVPLVGSPLLMFSGILKSVFPGSSALCHTAVYFGAPALTIAFCAVVYATLRRWMPGVARLFSGGR